MGKTPLIEREREPTFQTLAKMSAKWFHVEANVQTAGYPCSPAASLNARLSVGPPPKSNL